MTTLAIINDFLGQPELASEHGEMVDHMLELVHWFMAALFVGWSAFLVVVLWKFRQKKNRTADHVGVRGHATTHLEVGVVIVEVVLLLGFAFPLWQTRVEAYPVGSDPLKVRAIAYKFAFEFQYSGNDNVLGRVDYRQIAGDNPHGHVANDPASRDDFFSPAEMVLEVNRPVVIDVSSKDVIHNLHMPVMRIAQDATPGVRSHMWFTPTKTGSWDIICGQLCGPGHANMGATVTVMSREDFQEWWDERHPDVIDEVEPADPAEPVEEVADDSGTADLDVDGVADHEPESADASVASI